MGNEGLYEDGQQCKYEYVYTGCTWEELRCVQPTKRCTCNSPLYKDLKWSCVMEAIEPCGGGGLPPRPLLRPNRKLSSTTPTIPPPPNLQGKPCDPNEDVPTE